jgi:hypothetical protein
MLEDRWGGFVSGPTSAQLSGKPLRWPQVAGLTFFDCLERDATIPV